MRASHNRALIAARAAANPRPRAAQPISRDLSARVRTVPPLRAGITKSRAVKLTATQKDSDTGRQSLWSASAYNRPGSTPVTPKWDHTVQTMAGA